MLLPLFWPTKIAEVREEEISLQVEFCVQVVRFYVKFCSEKHDIVNFDLLLAVPDQKRLRQETALFINNLWWHQVMMIRSLLLSLWSLLLLVVGDVWTIWLSIFYLAVWFCWLKSTRRVLLFRFLLRSLWTWGVWFLLIMDTEPRVVNTLEEQINVSKWFKMNHNF